MLLRVEALLPEINTTRLELLLLGLYFLQKLVLTEVYQK